LKGYRKSVLEAFESDYPLGLAESRYVNTKLPSLPFGDNSFDLALSGNLLFYYSDKFDYSFHLDSVLALCRMALEVRIYPIQGSYSHSYRHYDDLLQELEKKGITAKTVSVPHHFQLGVDKMLLLARD